MTGVPASPSGLRPFGAEPQDASQAKPLVPNAVADKLREARALIERGWTQGAFARDAAGDRIYTHSPEAVCYCATGAIAHATDPHGWGAMYEVRNECFEALADVLEGADTDDIEDWNDEKGRTQAEVLAAFDKAIERAEGEQ